MYLACLIKDIKLRSFYRTISLQEVKKSLIWIKIEIENRFHYIDIIACRRMKKFNIQSKLFKPFIAICFYFNVVPRTILYFKQVFVSSIALDEILNIIKKIV